MSYCRAEGKDKIIFVTQEDHDVPSTALISLDPNDEEPGLILANGDINWECPCLGGMASGPCGVPFREAFSCFHYSEAESKGSDCYEQFKKMQDCMTSYPDVYPPKDDEADEDLLAEIAESSDQQSDENKTENSPDAAVSKESNTINEKTDIKTEVKTS